MMNRYVKTGYVGVLVTFLLAVIPANAECITAVEIKAENMSFRLPIETSNLREYLQSLLKVVGDLLQGKIVAENVVMQKAEIKRLLIIQADRIETPKAEMEISILTILGETIRSIDQLLPMITGNQVEWKNVHICAIKLQTQGMRFQNLRVWR